MSDRSKQLISHLLIVVFVFYYANICFFHHSHIINGVTIVHSHLHGKAHTQTDDAHSNSELTLISALSAFHSLQANACFAGLEIFLHLQAVIRPFFRENIILPTITHISLRAPPFYHIPNS